jgi:hypothetical protein
MPTSYGEIPQKKEIFFLAADETYFNMYAKTCIVSIKYSFDIHIHIHLYNPSPETKKWCDDKKVSYSYEIFDPELVMIAYGKFLRPVYGSKMNERQEKMIRTVSDKKILKDKLVKTYYACTRFIRLSEMLKNPTYVIMLDCDSIVRMPFVLPSKNSDIHIYEKNHLKTVAYKTHLASTIFYTGTNASLNLIRNHAELIKQEYLDDTFYWFLDQESLDIVIQKYKKSNLDVRFVDFELGDVSFIWCGKGNVKNSEKWIEEQSKYHIL